MCFRRAEKAYLQGLKRLQDADLEQPQGKAEVIRQEMEAPDRVVMELRGCRKTSKRWLWELQALITCSSIHYDLNLFPNRKIDKILFDNNMLLLIA